MATFFSSCGFLWLLLLLSTCACNNGCFCHTATPTATPAYSLLWPNKVVLFPFSIRFFHFCFVIRRSLRSFLYISKYTYIFAHLYLSQLGRYLFIFCSPPCFFFFLLLLLLFGRGPRLKCFSSAFSQFLVCILWHAGIIVAALFVSLSFWAFVWNELGAYLNCYGCGRGCICAN